EGMLRWRATGGRAALRRLHRRAIHLAARARDLWSRRRPYGDSRHRRRV
ncbi:uncharacterized protein METZ01_LOCUS496437, partial [marine metagenome]